MFSIVVMSFKRKDNKTQYIQGHRSEDIYENVQRLKPMESKEEALYCFQMRAVLLKREIKE